MSRERQSGDVSSAQESEVGSTVGREQRLRDRNGESEKVVVISIDRTLMLRQKTADRPVEVVASTRS